VSHSDQLVRALLSPAAYPHPVERVEVVETHISWVFLTGQFAYKVKKPVRLDFVDFSTLERRREACHDELRLNRRFAPQLYLDVVEITGSASQPVIAGPGEPLEYAVKMVQFPAEARLDRVLRTGGFGPADCDRLAAVIASSHLHADVAATDTIFGETTTIARQVQDILRTAAEQTQGGPEGRIVEQICTWVESELNRLTVIFEVRKSEGFVRECHGDLHCENIVMLDGQPVAFDCLEFRDDLRWIDCTSDIAFLSMDLADRGHPSLSHRLVNTYIEQTGDVRGVGVLRYYQVYRAVVRAVVTTLQAGAASRVMPERAKRYLQLAHQYTQPRQAALVITHGVSGSGKSTTTQELLEQIGAVRLRSDIERQRRDDRTVSAHAGSPADPYTSAARDAVYARLLDKAEIVLTAGYPLIVDATFLRQKHRDAFRHLAARLGVPFVILAFDADPDTLRQRIKERQQAGNDASEATLAVLEVQLREREPLADDEREFVVEMRDDDLRHVIERLQNALFLGTNWSSP
jgi:aminoglycoside phosphotransferase family enzyme/predicted kinase